MAVKQGGEIRFHKWPVMHTQKMFIRPTFHLEKHLVLGIKYVEINEDEKRKNEMREKMKIILFLNLHKKNKRTSVII